MTPNQRFSLTLFCISIAVAAIGWMIRRYVAKADKAAAERHTAWEQVWAERWQSVQRHDQRNSEAITAITEKVVGVMKTSAETNARLTTLYESLDARIERIDSRIQRITGR